MKFELPDPPIYKHSMAAVTFTIEYDNAVYLGAVSVEALWEHFGLDNPHAQAAIDAFLANRALIEAKISERFAAQRRDNVFLRVSDF